MRRLGVVVVGISVVAAVLGACGGSDASFCELASDFEATDLSDGADLEERLTDAVETLDRLVETAADEIVAEAIVVRDGVEDFVEGRRVLGADFTIASDRVRRYLADECGVRSQEGT